MTVAFAPARGARWGTEYGETHVEAHFGVYTDRTNRTTGEVTEHFRGLVPPEHKNPGQLHEAYQIRELRKWAPVRTYFGTSTRTANAGAAGGSSSNSSAVTASRRTEANVRPQPFSLIITIADPDGKAPIYDEMARRHPKPLPGRQPECSYRRAYQVQELTFERREMREMAKSSVHVVPRDGEWACAARGPTATRRGTTPRQTRFARAWHRPARTHRTVHPRSRWSHSRS